MKRVLTAFLLVPIGVYAALFAPWWIFSRGCHLFACLCFREYARMTGTPAPLGFAAGLLLLIAPADYALIVILLAVLASMCLPLAAPIPRRP